MLTKLYSEQTYVIKIGRKKTYVKVKRHKAWNNNHSMNDLFCDHTLLILVEGENRNLISY